MATARPDLWASTDPALLSPGEVETGNANLLKFLCDGCIDTGAPRRYEDLRRLNDGLRERGRKALISYLCGPAGIAKSATELSEMLLLDVLAGCCETRTRIEDAVSAVQSFIRRARLGLEPAGWSPLRSLTSGIADSRHSTCGRPASGASCTRRIGLIATSWRRLPRSRRLDF
jgi:hypothetical protein